jgi:inhibitor of cysteine peptidase
MKKSLFLLTIFILAISACAPASGDNTVSYPEPSYPEPVDSTQPQSDAYAPKPEDANLTRGEAYVDSSQLLTLESFPLQFMLNLKGNLPTPCNQLRIAVSPPDAENKVNVEVYSVINPDEICVQVLAPFEVNYSLGSFPAGTYSLWVNGVKVADFQS